MDRNVIIAEDTKGKKIAVINRICFVGKHSVNWDDVRNYLKTFVDKNYRIESTDDIIYIGNDLPNEYTGSVYTYRLKGTAAKPVYGKNKDLERYNVFHASILVRHDENGKMYLYDVIDIKKETGNPLEL